MNSSKPVYAKPALYAHVFLQLKEIAKECGYNLVLHGSMNRDLDLVAIPWEREVKAHTDMLLMFCDAVGGTFNASGNPDNILYSTTHHGRMQYVINLNRGGYQADESYVEDPQYYLDVSVMPALDNQP